MNKIVIALKRSIFMSMLLSMLCLSVTYASDPEDEKAREEKAEKDRNIEAKRIEDQKKLREEVEASIPKEDIAAIQKEARRINWSQGGFQACLNSGDCDSVSKCAYNRLCYNNCNLGLDWGVGGRKVGAFFASLVGINVEVDLQKQCRKNCVMFEGVHCTYPQPLDPSTAPLSGDPLKECMEYCGGYLPQFSMCRDACYNVNMAQLSSCFANNPDTAPEKCPVEDTLKDITNLPSEFSDRGFIQMAMRAIANDALCGLQNESRERNTPICQDGLAKLKELGNSEQTDEIKQLRKQTDRACTYASRPISDTCLAMCDVYPNFPTKTCRDIKAGIEKQNKERIEAIKEAIAVVPQAIEEASEGASKAKSAREAILERMRQDDTPTQGQTK